MFMFLEDNERVDEIFNEYYYLKSIAINEFNKQKYTTGNFFSSFARTMSCGYKLYRTTVRVNERD